MAAHHENTPWFNHNRYSLPGWHINSGWPRNNGDRKVRDTAVTPAPGRGYPITADTSQSKYIDARDTSDDENRSMLSVGAPALAIKKIAAITGRATTENITCRNGEGCQLKRKS